MKSEDAGSRSRFERIAQHLHKHGVEYIVIGGQAEALMGSARTTHDVDLCYLRSPENLRRLAEALRLLHPTLRNAPRDLPFRIDETSLALGDNFTFCTDLGDLDLLGWVEPLGAFDRVSKHAFDMDVAGVRVRVIGLEDLIAIKEHISRPKDKDSLLHLYAVRRVLEESKKRPPAAGA